MKQEGTPIVNAKPPIRSENEWEIWNIIEKKKIANVALQDDSISNKTSAKIIHQTGGCHCGAIRFSCQMPSNVVVWDCNCSDCRLRRNAHIILPKAHLQYTVSSTTTSEGLVVLKEYRWGTGNARHYFCSICGISPFYIPRSNPDGYAVTFACLDSKDGQDDRIENVEVKRFDGVHWEDFIVNEGKAIKGMSENQANS